MAVWTDAAQCQSPMRAFPFHRHHIIHELFYILFGIGEYRVDDKRIPLKPGDLIAAPAGKEAHQIVNTSASELRFLAFSTINEADVVDYPNTGKIGVVAGMPCSASRAHEPSGC